jgi:hypothetical protein
LKQSRRILISRKVFTAEDLRRIAQVFEKQQKLAAKSSHHHSISYEVRFEDDITIESDSVNVFAEESLLAPARPVGIRISFLNYELGRHMSLSLNHGDSSYGNQVMISAKEQTWLTENLDALKRVLDTVKPQDCWFQWHSTLLLNLIALGLGCLGSLVIGLATFSVFKVVNIQKPAIPATWEPLLATYGSLIASWPFRWLAGFAWGAFEVRRWLLGLWPNIEFDFGLQHLRTESVKRRRLAAVLTLIVLPIVANIITDAVKMTPMFSR